MATNLTVESLGFFRQASNRFANKRIALTAAMLLTLLVTLCVVMPIFVSPDKLDPTHNYAGPLQYGHLLGTDELGRDLLSRTLAGGRISLFIGLITMLLTMVIAVALGLISGYFGGIVDTVSTLITNTVLVLPGLLVVIVLSTLFGRGIFTVVISIAVVSWPTTARIVRSEVLSVREKEYIEAAKALGTSGRQLILRHILPNVLGPIIVSATLTVSIAILTESALSFLGIGIGQPIPTWGNLLNSGYIAIISNGDFFYALVPGMFIAFTVLCFNYIGDALRDAFDTRRAKL